MAEKQAAKTTARRPAKRTAAKASTTFTAEEKAAMRERAKELKRAASNAEGESDVLKEDR